MQMSNNNIQESMFLRKGIKSRVLKQLKQSQKKGGKHDAKETSKETEQEACSSACTCFWLTQRYNKGKILNKGGRPIKITKAKITGDNVSGSYWPSSKNISVEGNTKIKGKAKIGKPPYPRKKK
jgi:hypothetical protein